MKRYFLAARNLENKKLAFPGKFETYFKHEDISYSDECDSDNTLSNEI